MKRSVWIGFGMLCLLSASAWVAEPFGGFSTLPSLERQGLLYGAIGLAALIVSGARFRTQGEQVGEKSERSRLQVALAGVLLFGLPAIAIEFASGSIPAISRAALFAIVPTVV
jgi:hypothetical protein